MPFEKGNKEGAKRREFEAAVRKALVKDDWKRLHGSIEKMVQLAEEGERWALELIRDTLDGKPKQTLEVDQTVTVLDVGESQSLGSKLSDHLGRRAGPVGGTVQ